MLRISRKRDGMKLTVVGSGSDGNSILLKNIDGRNRNDRGMEMDKGI